MIPAKQNCADHPDSGMATPCHDDEDDWNYNKGTKRVRARFAEL